MKIAANNKLDITRLVVAALCGAGLFLAFGIVFALLVFFDVLDLESVKYITPLTSLIAGFVISIIMGWDTRGRGVITPVIVTAIIILIELMIGLVGFGGLKASSIIGIALMLVGCFAGILICKKPKHSKKQRFKRKDNW